jgi:hypothetical protein
MSHPGRLGKSPDVKRVSPKVQISERVGPQNGTVGNSQAKNGNPTVSEQTETATPIVAWIRGHKVISTVCAVCVGLLILGGISNAVEAHKTNTRYVPVPFSGSSGQTSVPQQSQPVPSAPTPAQGWSGDPEGSAYMNAPNQPINSGGFNYGSSYGSSSATPPPPTGGFNYGS